MKSIPKPIIIWAIVLWAIVLMILGFFKLVEILNNFQNPLIKKGVIKMSEEYKSEITGVHMDGTFRIYAGKLETIEQCKNFCQWYLNVCDELRS